MTPNIKWAAIVMLMAAIISPVLGQQTAEDWFYKGVDLSKQGKYDDAIQSYDEAIRINPADENAWNNEGVALKSLGRNAEVQEAYAKARELGYTG